MPQAARKTVVYAVTRVVPIVYVVGLLLLAMYGLVTDMGEGYDGKDWLGKVGVWLLGAIVVIVAAVLVAGGSFLGLTLGALLPSKITGVLFVGSIIAFFTVVYNELLHGLAAAVFYVLMLAMMPILLWFSDEGLDRLLYLVWLKTGPRKTKNNDAPSGPLEGESQAVDVNPYLSGEAQGEVKGVLRESGQDDALDTKMSKHNADLGALSTEEQCAMEEALARLSRNSFN